MIQDEEFWANNINASIAAVAEEVPEILNEFRAALITTLDSSSELRRDKMVLETASPYNFLGNGVIFDAKLMPELARAGFFSGFDEIWCFGNIPSLEKPEDVYFIGPYTPAKPISISVKKWMRKSKCVLGLGDGVGLNYITTERRIAELLEKEFGALEK